MVAKVALESEDNKSSIYIILIKFESLSVCLSVCVLLNSSYTFDVRITNDTSKDSLDPRECF